MKLFLTAALTALGLGLVSTYSRTTSAPRQALAGESNESNVYTWESWQVTYDAVRADHAGEGVTSAGVYRWTDTTPPDMLGATVIDGMGEHEVFDPVAYALLMSSEYWVLETALEDTIQNPGVGPRNCMAILISDPMQPNEFSCNPSPGCAPLPCQSSGSNEGFCACSFNPPTVKPSYCNATITHHTTPQGLSYWGWDCSGNCGSGECLFRLYYQDDVEIFYCGCQ